MADQIDRVDGRQAEEKDVSEFKPGTRYVSRDGREIRIYATDGYGDQPIHGAMPVDRGETSWLSHTWTSGGRFYAAEQLESDCDIVGLWTDSPEPKWRPFLPHELLRLVGRSVVRRKANVGECMMVSWAKPNGYATVGQFGVSAEALFKDWEFVEFNSDGNEVVTPCGVLEEEQVSTHKRKWTCLDCRESSDEMSWEDIHDKGWRKFKVDTLTHVICGECRKRNEIDEENAS